MKQFFRRLTRYCPVPVMVIYGICVIAGVIHLISTISVEFSDFFNRYISSVVRAFLAKATNLLPFSLAETIIILLPFIMAIIIVASVRVNRRSDEAGTRFLCWLFAVVTMFYSLFVFTFATAYQGTTLENKLRLDRQKVSDAELYTTAEILLNETCALADQINYIYGSSSVMPYSLDEMNTLLSEAYEKAYGKYPFLSELTSDIKYVLLSEPMTYTHISGVYTFYTGEANLNINFPDYTLPYTAAHELSHQRGVAREDEANFMAFLVCMESEDPYIRYSAYLNMYEYVSNALYRADNGLYNELLNIMDMRVRYEIIAYNQFFDKYRKSVASEVSSAVNDTFLKSQGQTEGTKSYGMVVDLAVAYYKNAAEAY